MSVYNVRLNTFESTKEKDITDIRDELNSHHQLNQFIGNSIRFVLQNKDAYREFTKTELDSYGLTYEKTKFFSDISKQLGKLRDKIDSIYDMALKTYTMAQMNKKLGLEGKSDNQLLVSFLLEKQLNELENSLGMNISENEYTAGKLNTAHKLADDTVKLMLETYDEMLTAIKSSMVVQTQPVQFVEQTVMNDKPKEEEKETIEIKTLTNTDVELSDDDYIDFGNADISALEKFTMGN